MEEKSLKEKTAKGLFWGGISNGVQQFLGMLFGIYLARTLNAEDYGLVGMLAIFTSIASTIINSGFSVALTNKQDVTHKDYNAVFWFTMIVGLVLYIILFFSAPFIARFYGRPELTALSRFLFISFFFSGLSVVSYTVMFKQLMVKEQAKIDITSLLISGIVGVTLAINNFAYWALAVQSVVYIVLGALLRFIISPWRPTLDLDFKPLIQMFPFSVRLFFSNIFTQISNNIFSILLGKFYSASQVGYYSQGNKWMVMGQQLIGGMLNSVVQPVLIQAGNTDRLIFIFRKMIRFTAFISFPALLGLAFVSEEFILITIGEKWLPVVPILQILCLIGAIYPFWILYIQLLIVCERSDILFRGNIIIGLFQIIVILCMYPYGLMWMVRIYVLTYLVGLFYWHYYASKLVSIRLVDVLMDIIPYLLICLLTFAFVHIILFFVHHVFLILIAKIFLSVLIYSIIMYYSNSTIFIESVNFIWKRKKQR